MCLSVEGRREGRKMDTVRIVSFEQDEYGAIWAILSDGKRLEGVTEVSPRVSEDGVEQRQTATVIFDSGRPA